MAVDFSNFPQALGQNVQRIDLNSGMPLRATLDNELYLHEWVKANTQALDTAVTTAVSTADAASAAVVTESIARAAADGALAANIVSAEARATGGSYATAQMQLVATSGIGGAAAEFSWQLRTSSNNYPVGMSAYVTGPGDGAIVFTAQSFQLTDPSYAGGAPGNVFSYSGGVFQFNVPVLLDTGELAGNAVTEIASSSAALAGTSLVVSKSFYGGTDALVIVTCEPSATVSPTAVTAQTITQRTYPFYVDGVAVNSLTAYDAPIGSNSATVRDAAGSGTTVVVGALLWYPQNVTKQFLAPGLAAGVHTFGIQEPYGLNTNVTISVIEFKR